MDEGSGYCDSSVGIESLSNAAKSATIVMTGAGEGRNLLEKDSVESNMKPRIFADRLVIMGLVVGREREGLTILQVCWGDR